MSDTTQPDGEARERALVYPVTLPFRTKREQMLAAALAACETARQTAEEVCGDADHILNALDLWLAESGLAEKVPDEIREALNANQPRAVLSARPTGGAALTADDLEATLVSVRRALRWFIEQDDGDGNEIPASEVCAEAMRIQHDVIDAVLSAHPTKETKDV